MRQENTTTTLKADATDRPWTDKHQPASTQEDSMLEKAGGKIKQAKAQAETTAAELAATAKEKLHETSETAKERYVEVRDQVAHTGAQAKEKIVTSFERQPLMYVAGALAAGVLLGLAIPRARKEKETFASTGRKLRDAAESAKEEAIEASKSAVEAGSEAFQENIKNAEENTGPKTNP